MDLKAANKKTGSFSMWDPARWEIGRGRIGASDSMGYGGFEIEN